MQDGSLKLDIGARLVRLLRSDLKAFHEICALLGKTPDELRAQIEDVDTIPLLTLLRICEAYEVSVDHLLGLGFDADAMALAVLDVFPMVDSNIGPLASALNPDLRLNWMMKSANFVTRSLMDHYLAGLDKLSEEDVPDRLPGRYDPWAEPAASQSSDERPEAANSERAETAPLQ